jgi:hypothetical protein
VENLTSLPTLMRGFSSRDQQLWMDFIIEAAGVLDHTDRLEQVNTSVNINFRLQLN